jgi:hypothetical protein
MSVQVLRVRFPGLSVAVSVERSHRQGKSRLLPSAPKKMERARSDRRFSAVPGVEPSLVKLQM